MCIRRNNHPHSVLAICLIQCNYTFSRLTVHSEQHDFQNIVNIPREILSSAAKPPAALFVPLHAGLVKLLSLSTYPQTPTNKNGMNIGRKGFHLIVKSLTKAGFMYTIERYSVG